MALSHYSVWVQLEEDQLSQNSCVPLHRDLGTKLSRVVLSAETKRSVCLTGCACACVYAWGSLVKQLILVISVVNWSPQAVHWPLGRTSSLNCLCRDEYTHAWAHKHTQNTCTHTHTRTHIGLAAVAHCAEITGGSCRGDEPENLCWNQYIIRILAATYEVDWIFVVTLTLWFQFLRASTAPLLIINEKLVLKSLTLKAVVVCSYAICQKCRAPYYTPCRVVKVLVSVAS